MQLLARGQLHLARPHRGRLAAVRSFDRLLARCNDIGFLSEEFDPLTGHMLGIFRNSLVTSA
jgi:hypothetical protein